MAKFNFAGTFCEVVTETIVSHGVAEIIVSQEWVIAGVCS